MPAFTYQAVDPAGTRRRGVVEAADAVAARRMLRERALLPVALRAAGEPRAEVAALGARFRRRALGGRALATITRQISTLVGSDVNIEEARPEVR